MTSAGKDEFTRRKFFRILATLSGCGAGSSVFLSESNPLHQGNQRDSLKIESTRQVGHVLSHPVEAPPKLTLSSDFSSSESAIQHAIDYVADNGGGDILLSDGILPYNTSEISFAPEVGMTRSGCCKDAINPLAYGATANGVADDGSAIDAAVSHAAHIACAVVDLQGKNYGLRPGYTLQDDVTLTNGTITVQNTGDYTVALDQKAGTLTNLTLDQSEVSKHDGRGIGLRQSGDGVVAKNVKVIGERSVRDEELQYTFQPYKAKNVRIINCRSEEASGTALRPKQTENLVIKDFEAINWRLKGFGYDSDVDNVGSIHIDGYESRSDTSALSRNGFLIDPGPNPLSLLNARGLHISGAGAKIQYVDTLRLDDVSIKASDHSYALRIDNVNETTIGNLELNNRFKIEPPCGPIHVLQLVSNLHDDVPVDFNIENKGSERLTIEHAVLRNGSRGVDSDQSANHSNRLTVLQSCIFDPKTSNAVLCVAHTYGPSLFVVGDVTWKGGTNTTNLAAGRNDRSQIRRNFGKPRVYIAEDIPSNEGNTTNDGYEDGDKIIKQNPRRGDPAFWRYDAENDIWLSGPIF